LGTATFIICWNGLGLANPIINKPGAHKSNGIKPVPLLVPNNDVMLENNPNPNNTHPADQSTHHQNELGQVQQNHFGKYVSQSQFKHPVSLHSLIGTLLHSQI
jgi:hypothetical protein